MHLSLPLQTHTWGNIKHAVLVTFAIASADILVEVLETFFFQQG